jgi:hypothetical protein
MLSFNAKAIVLPVYSYTGRLAPGKDNAKVANSEKKKIKIEHYAAGDPPF